jgi:hypothetical protein
MNLLTKNQLINHLQTLAESHLQINGFGYGPESEQEIALSLQSGENTGLTVPSKLPFMWVTPVITKITNGSIFYEFELLIGDLQDENTRNRVEAESDTLLICLDIVSKLSDESYPWSLVRQSTIRPFFNGGSSSYTGHRMDIALELPFNYDYCMVPIQ